MTASRREFLKASGGLLAAGGILHAAPEWKKQIGLELFTVRDLLAKDFEGTLANVAALGYREVEPVGYNKLDPGQFRALLDKYKLTAPSTHAGATAGPGLEKELEGHRIMGFLYTEVRAGGGGTLAGGTPAGGTPAASAAARGPGGTPAGGTTAGGTTVGGTPTAAATKRGPVAGQPRAPQSVESVKRAAAQYNEHGKIARKFGMKILIHNHTQEFELLDDGKTTQYDILLAETDPVLVAMQLDIGWASVAGQDILEMFRKNPGRYELWHVKDAVGIKGIDPTLAPNDRRAKTKLVPIGQGEVDYRAIFAKASQAGLKHFAIEQDNAAESGDSMGTAKICFDGMVKVLS